MTTDSSSGLAYLRYAASGRNRFVSGIAALAALGGFLFGYDTGIVSQAQPFFKKSLHTSTIEQSWIVASLLLGAIVGAAIAGYLSERIGRKWTKFLSGCVYALAALGAGFATSVALLIAARAVLGLSVGTASFVAPEYISEQTPRRFRGGTVTYNQIMVTLGIFVAYLIGYAFHGVTNNWRWMFALGALPGIALAIAMVFVPRSPRWLVKYGRVDEAKRVLERTRNPEDDIDEELADIQDVVEQEKNWRIRDLFGQRARPLILVGIALAVFQQFVGINTVIYFATTILNYTGATTNHAVLLAVYVGLTNFVTTIVAALLMDWAGRRRLLIPGTILLTIALFALGAYFHWPMLYKGHSWVGLACVITYIVGFAIGLGPVFWLMISEIFPLQFRSQAMALCTMFNWAANFIVSFYFLQMVDSIGKAATFWIYGAMGVLATVFFLRKVPETKQRSLEEIEREIGADELAEANPSGERMRQRSA
jgi:sugar porter (SP) family MFS transporter